ncbi:MAG: hypothetical protein DRJ05_12550, partial [Bacteroidetes bacterium]
MNLSLKYSIMKKVIFFSILTFLMDFTNYSNAQGIIPNHQIKKQVKKQVQTTDGFQRKSDGEKANAQWTGTISNDWNTAGNWSIGSVPNATDNASIPVGTPYSPVIGSGVSAYCNNLYLYSGASLDQNAGSYFYCYGNFDAGFGQFTMTGSSYLYFRGANNNLWYDDYQDDTYTYVRVEKVPSSASMTMQQDMTCSGTFEIREGVFEMTEYSTLTITNTSTNAFEVENGGKLELDIVNRSVVVYGGIVFRDGSQVYHLNCPIYVGGNLSIENNVLYNIHLGNVFMNGSGTQYIQD